MSDRGWYVIQSNPRKEAFVRDRLSELGREVFLPMVSERRRGAKRATLSPFFPGYLFARLSGNAGDLGQVRWLHGVRRVLGDGVAPRPVENLVVEAIRLRADPTGRVRFGKSLRAGSKVQILDGPFCGLTGILERSSHGPEERVSVLLELFRRTTRVQLRAEEVRAQGRS